MATNSNVTKVHKSLMQNTAKAATANKGKAAAKKTPAKAAAKTTTQKKNVRRYTRNSAMSSLFGSALAALGGAAIITGFDVMVNQYAPTVSSGLRTGVKGVLGVGFKMWGKKIPVVGSYSDAIGNAFLLATGLDVLGNVVVPYVMNWLSPVAAPVAIKDPATGQLGVQVAMPDGQIMRIFDDTSNAYSSNYASAGAYGGSYWQQ